VLTSADLSRIALLYSAGLSVLEQQAEVETFFIATCWKVPCGCVMKGDFFWLHTEFLLCFQWWRSVFWAMVCCVFGYCARVSELWKWLML